MRGIFLPFIQNTFGLTLPTWMNRQIDHGWRSRGAHCLKTYQAAFFGFLLPRALKVQHPPAACWIDEALLMGGHLLASTQFKDFLLHCTHTHTWGWSLFSSAWQDFIHYLIAEVCVCYMMRLCTEYTVSWLIVFMLKVTYFFEGLFAVSLEIQVKAHFKTGVFTDWVSYTHWFQRRLKDWPIYIPVFKASLSSKLVLIGVKEVNVKKNYI